MYLHDNKNFFIVIVIVIVVLEVVDINFHERQH